jgi:hypothetical protein
MLMEIQQIMDILDKIESHDGKVRFLEKCLFEEKNDNNKIKILGLLRKLTKRRFSIEERIRQREKEKIESVVEEFAPPLIDKKIKKEPERQVKTVRLESAVEPSARENELLDREPITSSASTKDYITEESPERPKKIGDTESYRPKSAEESTYVQRNARTFEEGRYLPKIDLPKPILEKEQVSEEEYKRRELFKVGKEAEVKKEEYRRKLMQS